MSETRMTTLTVSWATRRKLVMLKEAYDLPCYEEFIKTMIKVEKRLGKETILKIAKEVDALDNIVVETAKTDKEMRRNVGIKQKTKVKADLKKEFKEKGI